MLKLLTLEQLSALLLAQVADANTILVIADQSDRDRSLAMVVRGLPLLRIDLVSGHDTSAIAPRIERAEGLALTREAILRLGVRCLHLSHHSILLCSVYRENHERLLLVGNDTLISIAHDVL